jgi:thiol-disulfide isomerase/thioredoxin
VHRTLKRSLVVLGALTLATAGSAAELRPWTGGETPPLVLQDMHGRSHSLADDYRGRVVLVNFWATWCEPCLAEMPSIERLRQSLAGRPFAVLAVNLGEPVGRIERFLDKVPLGFPMLLDRNNAAAKAWRARVVPASYLVGRDGRIRYVHYGELDWSGEPIRKRVAELLE